MVELRPVSETFVVPGLSWVVVQFERLARSRILQADVDSSRSHSSSVSLLQAHGFRVECDRTSEILNPNTGVGKGHSVSQSLNDRVDEIMVLPLASGDLHNVNMRPFRQLGEWWSKNSLNLDGTDGFRWAAVRTMNQEKQSVISKCKLFLLVSEIECDRVLRDGVDPREAKPDKLDHLIDMAR